MFLEEEQTHIMEDMKIEKNNIEKDAHRGKNPGIHSQDSSTGPLHIYLPSVEKGTQSRK